MKITCEGVVPGNVNVPWWVGKTAECRTCGVQAVLELEDGQPPKGAPAGTLPLISEHGERHPGGRQWVSGKCPTPCCPGLLELENVFRSQVTGAAAAREFNPNPAKP